MRILYLITGLRLGGAEKQLLLIAKNMQRNGHEVFVAAMESGGIMAKQFRDSQISIEELNITGGLSLIYGYRLFGQLIKRFKPDVIHSHMIHANLFAAVHKLFNGQYRLVSTAHNIQEGSSALMFGYRLLNRIPNWSTNVSKEAFERFVRHKYFRKGSASYVPNAIDTDVFNPALFIKNDLRQELRLANNDHVFFSAGRLHQQKNYPMLIKAFQLVKQVMPNSVLIIAGEGELLNELEKLVNSLNLTSSVRFIGRRNDMPALLAMCNCFVLSSKFEGFGLVVGEAMAMQKNVIATDCGGIKEVMGGFGKLITVDDAAGLAEAMTALYHKPAQPSCLTKAREHIIKNYSVGHIMAQWEEIYAC